MIRGKDVPVVSVIIPFRNTEKYLKKCLDSVLNQSFQDYEVICVDDCSEDTSAKIAEEYTKKDYRFKLIRNTVIQKVGGSRNVGLELATGKYVYFLDSDDYLDSDYFSEMVSMMESTNADVLMNTRIITEVNGESSDYHHPTMPKIPEGGMYIDKEIAIEKSFCAVWMRMFRKSLLDNNGINFHDALLEDIGFNYITNTYANSIYAFEGNSAYHYLIRDNSAFGVIKSNNERDLQTMKAYDRIFDYLEKNRLLGELETKLFFVSGFFKTDTKEKYDFYKEYFLKIKDYFYKNLERYNEMDRLFAESILNTNDFEDFISKYPVSLAMAFLKRKKGNQ